MIVMIHTTLFKLLSGSTLVSDFDVFYPPVSPPCGAARLSYLHRQQPVHLHTGGLPQDGPVWILPKELTPRSTGRHTVQYQTPVHQRSG